MCHWLFHFHRLFPLSLSPSVLFALMCICMYCLALFLCPLEMSPSLRITCPCTLISPLLSSCCLLVCTHESPSFYTHQLSYSTHSLTLLPFITSSLLSPLSSNVAKCNLCSSLLSSLLFPLFCQISFRVSMCLSL